MKRIKEEKKILINSFKMFLTIGKIGSLPKLAKSC